MGAMGDAMKKVKPGDPLVIPAGTFNAFIDATRYVQERRFDQGTRAVRQDEATILVRNDSSYDAPRYGLLWLRGLVFEGLHRATRPEHPFLSELAIAAEPIAAGQVGRAWTEGCHPLRIADWETLVDGDFPLLAVSRGGSFDVLAWTGTGTIPVLGRLEESPLVLADLTNRSAS